MAKPRVTLPSNGLGPVQRQGDRARLQDRVIQQAQAAAKASSSAKPPSATVKRAPPYSRPGSPAEAQKRAIAMKAPTASVRPSQAGAKFTPGSRADMAYTGLRAPPAASKAVAKIKPKRLGSGVEGAALTAVAAGAYAAYDKFKNRGRKPPPKKAK